MKHPSRVLNGILASSLLIGGSAGILRADDTRLAQAAQADDTAAVHRLLRLKAPIDAPLGDGSTALHWSAANGDLALVKLLLQAGASTRAVTRVGAETPLLVAARNGDPAVVGALLQAGADPNVSAANGTTPLMLAAASGSAPTVLLLLNHGAKPNVQEKIYGQTALIFAAAKDRATVIRALIQRGADPTLTSTVTSLSRVRLDDDGNPIGAAPGQGGESGAGGPGGAGGRRRGQGAAAAGGKEAASADIAGGGQAQLDADGNPLPRRRRQTATPDDGTTPAAGGAGETVGGGQPQLDTDGNRVARPRTGRGGAGQQGVGGQAGAAGRFAGAGGGVGRARRNRTFGGNTPLIIAAREGNIAAARALVESGANIDEPNAGDKTTALVTAICNGHYDLAHYLLEKGADVNLKSSDGLSPLYAVIDTQWAPVGWSPNPKTDQEQTTYLDLMQQIIARGAVVDAKLTNKLWFRPPHHDEGWVSPVGATAFWRAAQATDIAAMRLLVAHGADVKVTTSEGVNALMVAAGLGWNGNYSTQGPDSALATVQYCLTLGIDPLPQSMQGYTALGGAAYRGDNALITLLLSKGARLDTRTNRGWSVTDMANGPSLRSSVPVPHPETVALLLKAGAPPLTPTDNEEILGIIRRRPATTAANAPAAQTDAAATASAANTTTAPATPKQP